MWFFFLATGSEIGMPCITLLRMLLWGKYCMQKTTSLTVLAVHTGENGLDCWTDTSLHFSANIIALNLRYILMFFFLSSFRNIFYVYLKKTIYEQAFKTFQNIFHLSYLCVELQNTTFDGSCLVNLEGAIKEIGGLESIFLLETWSFREMCEQWYFVTYCEKNVLVIEKNFWNFFEVTWTIY